MAKSREDTGLKISTPSVYLVRTILFLIVVGVVVFALQDEILRNFASNPVLNGFILGVLGIGILYAFVQILNLWPAARWINQVRRLDRGLLPPVERAPSLVAPMAAMLDRDWGQVSLAALAMRSILDSVGSRLEEGREIARYLTGLLVFLGLLGTFWGLLQTVNAVGATISGLADAGGAPEDAVAQLIRNLREPLGGMGTAFSSSLFGLGGSLVVGFLELQASAAQGRFYSDLEDWLSSRAEVTRSSGASGSYIADDAGVIAALQGIEAALAANTETQIKAQAGQIAELKDEIRALNRTFVRTGGKD